MIEIKNIRLLHPVMVSFTQDEQELSVFVYVDSTKGDIIIPDSSEIKNLDEFKLKFIEFNLVKPLTVPKVPKDLEKNKWKKNL